jgi:hypothetical protein
VYQHVDYRETGLGLVIAGVPLTGTTILGTAANILGLGGNPKDPERFARADAMYQRGLQGDPVAEIWLECWSGNQAAVAKMQAAGLWNPSDTACGFATDKAKAYAAQKLAELKARRLAGQVGTGLIQQSDIPARVVGTVTGAFRNPWVWAGLAAAVGGVVLLSRRRRRR